MSQILRAFKMEVMQIRGFCGSQRSMRNHYETLRISQDASQQDIRNAFLKLSKEMHPDTSDNTSHSNFVKITEAYKVLSKQDTKQDYDMRLKMSEVPQGRKVRIVYSESGPYVHNFHNERGSSEQNDDNYFGIKGLKRVTNITLAFLLFIFSAVGFSVQMFLIGNGALRRDKILEDCKKNEDAYRKLKEGLSHLSQEERLQIVKDRMSSSKWT